MFISEEIHILYGFLIDPPTPDEFLKKSFHADFEHIIKIALLRLLVFHYLILDGLLVYDNTEFIKSIQGTIQFPLFFCYDR